MTRRRHRAWVALALVVVLALATAQKAVENGADAGAQDATWVGELEEQEWAVDVLWESEMPRANEGPSSLLAPPAYHPEADLFVFATQHFYVDTVIPSAGKSGFGAWPYGLDRASFLAAPLRYDIDRDGSEELLMTTTTGEIFFLRHSGLPVLGGRGLVVPPLPVPVPDSSTRGDGTAAAVPRALLFAKPRDGRAAVREYARNIRVEQQQDQLFMEPHDPRYSRQFEAVCNATGWFGAVEGYATHPWVYVDAHVLATPALTHARVADAATSPPHVLVVPVSSYLPPDGRTRYGARAGSAGAGSAGAGSAGAGSGDADHGTPGPAQLDLEVAEAVAFDLATGQLLWRRELERSRERVAGRARSQINAPPSVGDVDGDGTIDVVLATATGNIYALSTHDGAVLAGYPVAVGAGVEREVLLCDLDGDPATLEMVVATNAGALSVRPASDPHTVLWQAGLQGALSEVALVHFDTDDRPDLMVGSSAGLVWVLSGATGSPVAPHLPLRVEGRVFAAPVLLDHAGAGTTGALAARPEYNAVVATAALDGYLYLSHVGPTGVRTHRVDIGDTCYTGFHTYSAYDKDMREAGAAVLLVPSISGHVQALRAPFLRVPSPVDGVAFVPHQAAAFSGYHMTVYVDTFGACAHEPGRSVALYIHGKGNRVAALEGLVVSSALGSPARLRLDVPIPHHVPQGPAMLRVVVVDAAGRSCVDDWRVHFHLGATRALKWFLSICICLVSVSVWLVG